MERVDAVFELSQHEGEKESVTLRFLELSPYKETGRNEGRGIFYRRSHMVLLCVSAGLEEKALRNLEVSYMPEIAHLAAQMNRPYPILVLLMKSDLFVEDPNLDLVREKLNSIIAGPNLENGLFNLVDVIPCSSVTGGGLEQIKALLLSKGLEFYRKVKSLDEADVEVRRRKEEDRMLEAQKNREETLEGADSVVNNCFLS